ncbi:Poly(A) RNA polymerase gld-2 [Schistosoma japonicum]|nr:Poly(A) RNA polymerase gld-2 [Schistosoma japonicum]
MLGSSASGNKLKTIVSDRKRRPDGTLSSLASAKPFFTSTLTPNNFGLSPSLYMENLSMEIWKFYTSTKQSSLKYTKKLHLRNALHMVISGVFENAGLFIVGSSINGFGSHNSDMDMCLIVTSRNLHQKHEATFILSQLLPSLKKCRFLRDFRLIRAKTPIIKFHDTHSTVDCDINVNNVIGIYNTHLLAMYAKRPLGIFIKHWAQCLDIHDAQRGRLSTYSLLLMLIHYLQVGCSPPVLPNLQEKFPKLFNHSIPPYKLDMCLQLPWNELQSNNSANLSELFIGFIDYYANRFDFNKWAISIRHTSSSSSLLKTVAMKHSSMNENTVMPIRDCKIFIEEPFSRTNTARSIHSDNIVSSIKEAFNKTNTVLCSQQPLESLWS